MSTLAILPTLNFTYYWAARLFQSGNWACSYQPKT